MMCSNRLFQGVFFFLVMFKYLGVLMCSAIILISLGKTVCVGLVEIY